MNARHVLMAVCAVVCSIVAAPCSHAETVRLVCDWMGQPRLIFDVDYGARTVAYVSGYFSYYPHTAVPATIDETNLS